VGGAQGVNKQLMRGEGLAREQCRAAGQQQQGMFSGTVDIRGEPEGVQVDGMIGVAGSSSSSSSSGSRVQRAHVCMCSGLAVQQQQQQQR
jgi:hypothetical protein